MSEAYLTWLKELIAEDNLSKFYLSKKWRRLSAKIIREQKECQICKANHTYGKAEIVHHVNEVRKHPELALSEYTDNGERNLIAVCQKCHNRIHFGSGRYTNVEKW